MSFICTSRAFWAALGTETVAMVEAAGTVAGMGANEEADAGVEEGANEAEAGIVAAETVTAGVVTGAEEGGVAERAEGDGAHGEDKGAGEEVTERISSRKKLRSTAQRRGRGIRPSSVAGGQTH